MGREPLSYRRKKTDWTPYVFLIAPLTIYILFMIIPSVYSFGAGNGSVSEYKTAWFWFFSWMYFLPICFVYQYYRTYLALDV